MALTATEYELLRVLSVNAGRVVTRDALLRQMWPGRDSADERLAPVNNSRLCCWRRVAVRNLASAVL